jgi:hypothetical protein
MRPVAATIAPMRHEEGLLLSDQGMRWGGHIGHGAMSKAEIWESGVGVMRCELLQQRCT